MKAIRDVTALLLVSLCGCVALKPGAEDVRVTYDPADVGDATLVGQAEFGVGPLFGSSQLDDLARNFAASRNGDIALIHPTIRTVKGITQVHPVDAFRSAGR